MRVVSDNIIYQLFEVDGKLGKELTIMPRKLPITMTPWGMEQLAQEIMAWVETAKIGYGG